MADKGVFSSVEQNRRDKYEIKRRDKYLLLAIVSAIVFSLGLAFSKTGEISKDFFLLNLNNIKSFDDLKRLDFKIEYYLIFITYVSILWYALIIKKPLLKKDGLFRKIGYIIFLPLNLLFKFYLYLAKKINPNKKDNKNETLLNTVFKILYSPINFLLFTFEESKPFKFAPCWFGKIEKDFFKQTHNKVDEILRVNELVALKEFHNIFTNDEYKKLIRLFKSESQFIDYLKITEGYLTEKKTKKYDELFFSNRKSTLRNFRAFNGKDKVYFSMDFILFKVDEQSKIFEDFLTKRFLRGSTRINTEILNLFKYTVNDKKFEYNIVGVSKKDLESNKFSSEEKKKINEELKKVFEAKQNNDIKYIENLLKERLVIWFKFFFARVILQRYCNIPAGLLVVKIDDYSMRMITEVYNDKKTINIGKNQNDGSSNSFNGDGLVNLFLYTWNVFLYGRKTKILKDLDYNINTLADTSSMYDKDIENIISNMEKEVGEYKKNN